jgi:hypothetical protein
MTDDDGAAAAASNADAAAVAAADDDDSVSLKEDHEKRTLRNQFVMKIPFLTYSRDISFKVKYLRDPSRATPITDANDKSPSSNIYSSFIISLFRTVHY